MDLPYGTDCHSFEDNEDIEHDNENCNKPESDNVIYKSKYLPNLGLLWINKVPKVIFITESSEESYFDPYTTKIIVYTMFILLLLILLVFIAP